MLLTVIVVPLLLAELIDFDVSIGVDSKLVLSPRNIKTLLNACNKLHLPDIVLLPGYLTLYFTRSRSLKMSQILLVAVNI